MTSLLIHMKYQYARSMLRIGACMLRVSAWKWHCYLYSWNTPDTRHILLDYPNQKFIEGATSIICKYNHSFSCNIAQFDNTVVILSTVCIVHWPCVQYRFVQDNRACSKACVIWYSPHVCPTLVSVVIKRLPGFMSVNAGHVWHSLVRLYHT